MFPLRDFKCRFNNKKLDLSIAPIYDFLVNANIELYNEDANKIIDDNDNEPSLIFLNTTNIVAGVYVSRPPVTNFASMNL